MAPSPQSTQHGLDSRHSPNIAQEYLLPNKPYQWCLVASCGLILTTWWSRDNLLPETDIIVSKIWSLGGTAPQIARSVYKVQPFFFLPLLVSHTIETAWLWWSRLAKQEMGVKCASWWLWIIDSMIEGLGTTNRFDEAVMKAREAGK